MIGVGYSHSKNPFKAAHEAASKALSQIQGQSCHSCLVFSTVGYSQTILLEGIHTQVGNVPMIGCSSEGVITTGIADENSHCVVVLVMADPRIRLGTAGYPDLADSSKAGRAIGEALSEKIKDDSQCIILLPCGLDVVVDDLLPEIEKRLARNLPIIGGSAGNNFAHERTYQYYDWQIYEGGVSAAVLSGDFDLLTGISHGCVPIGLEMEITRTEGNRIYEIDNRPVMDVMTDFVGEGIVNDFEKNSPHFYIGQRVETDQLQCYDRYIIRNIVRHYPEDKSVSLQVKMHKGDTISVCRSDHDKMFSACRQSILTLKENLGERLPFLIFDINCAGRGKIILAEEEKTELLRTFQSGLAPNSPWIGFFSFGEFCPVGQKNAFHNNTNVFALFVWR
ncbi:MAG: FIST signal transduction protein [Smithellaceae bacterium]